MSCLSKRKDQAVLALLACGLQETVNKMNDSVKKRGESTTACNIYKEVPRGELYAIVDRMGLRRVSGYADRWRHFRP
ncbi:hypothetical protein EVAR_13964_1 [Eumeta japonica]|uniref:Uncharacterized protein n=1 Tax=Eumeta variegata TaxID=151549 RepID=A0A4C1U8E0_EUMVA|nr:hypothetical protein EVAR_13964_1 [Eumeta japonica]